MDLHRNKHFEQILNRSTGALTFAEYQTAGEFAGPGAPKLDFVFTVCDNMAKEQCPYWPGQPMTAHWGVADPAAVKGTPEEVARAFRDAFTILDRRIGLFLSLPLTRLEDMAIKREIDQIGRS
jgi:arsenate reductase (thioredoxin)